MLLQHVPLTNWLLANIIVFRSFGFRMGEAMLWAITQIQHAQQTQQTSFDNQATNYQIMQYRASFVVGQLGHASSIF